MTNPLVDARNKIESMRKEAVRKKWDSHSGPKYHMHDGEITGFAKSIMCIREVELREMDSLEQTIETLRRYAKQSGHPASQVLEDAANVLIGKRSLLNDNEETSQLSV